MDRVDGRSSSANKPNILQLGVFLIAVRGIVWYVLFLFYFILLAAKNILDVGKANGLSTKNFDKGKKEKKKRKKKSLT